IRTQLNESVASIKVVTINQKSAPEEKLDYSRYKNTEKGRRVIAIGGLTLSRGLTLEGLSVSYFYRNSKAYDTLLQMGRWFGYRPGYDDLFRIWMNIDAQNWYAHIANAVAELRTDFRRMSANRLPPSRFGIRVKAHPDTLIVTAQNKMRSGQEFEHSISFSASGVETAYVAKDQLNQQNVDWVKQFIKERGTATTQKNKYLWSGVKKQAIAQFLAGLNISNLNMQFLPDHETGERPLVKFIENNPYTTLDEWDICIPQGENDIVPNFLINTGTDVLGEVACRSRQFEKTPKSASYFKLNRQRVGDTSDEKVGMSISQLAAVENAWKDELAKDPEKRGKSIPGYMYRKIRSKPLLTIHFIKAVEPKVKPDTMMKAIDIGTDPIVAISLSFPDFDPESKGKSVVYRLNKVALRDLIGEEEEEGDDTD
ncbi:Z1 domain-containing protein, partial [Herbaspirillum chlorophenolicum]